MKPGLSRFNYFFDQLQPILTTASKQKNPALWLYRNNARTPLFMLEALAKMYAGLHNRKKFSKIKAHFKLLEDSLGAIDYYDMVARDLVNNKKIPARVITYLQAQSREKLQSLNEILVDNDWLAPTDNRIRKIQKKLSEVNWLDESDEVKLMAEFYGESIYGIVEFTEGANYQFANMEAEVHELRRKLRWLSIYPQAVRGAIQLGKTKVPPKHLSKYCTKEITNSPFNKMPDRAEARYFLLLEQKYFYALSWMIAELGKLKDNGLHIIAVKEALEQTTNVTDEDAYKKTYQILGKEQSGLQQLLDKAGTVCKTYFKEQNLEHLVMGTNPLNDQH
ncbi:MAG: hypothetical protein H7Z13_19350 [Ferruginibacter sp.]|nr:hypothetical protein [Ferruginibacter sp.]